MRVHDPKSPHLAAYNGIPVYPPNERWRVAGTFTPYEQPKTVTTAPSSRDSSTTTTRWAHRLRVAGDALQLVAFGRPAGELHVLFTDATSGVTTYPACRSLPIVGPDADGAVTLDFNRASNLPCSFTDYATCPVAPPENRLSIAVEAGEKNPR